MSCPYCTPSVDPDTGESLEFCKEFITVKESQNHTQIRTFLSQDADDGSWWRTVLMADEWPLRRLPVCITFEASPFCPHCGRRLHGYAAEL